ncbi:MAG: AAA family ATPase [Candidatus Micrarchaeota archaeon]
MKLKEVVGNEDAKSELLQWALDWERNKKSKPILLTGPIGTGKTTIVNALAQELAWNTLVLTTQDLRNTKKTLPLITPGKGLTGFETLFIIEDADATLTKRDVSRIKELEPEHPLVISAADAWDPKISDLRTYCRKIELKKINSRTITSFLTNYAKENNLNEELIPGIVDSSEGDLRSAIIDLTYSTAGSRERNEDVFKELLKVFKHGFNEANQVSNSTDLDLFFRWVEENIPAEYEDPQEIADAFQWLSKAFVYKGRINNRQYYTLMRYLKPVGLGGVAVSKKNKYAKFTRYQFPSIIRKLSQTKKNRGAIKSAGLKIGSRTHASSKKGIETIKLTGVSEESSRFYNLSEDENALIASTINELEANKSNKSKKKR